MANAAGKLFASYLEAKGLKFKVLSEDMDVLSVGWTLENTRTTIFFEFNDESTNVHIEAREFLMVSADKCDKMLSVVNDLNTEYRWVKFTVNKEGGEIRAEDDAVLQLDTAAEESLELMLRMTHIIEEAYPVFMKAMWS